MKITFIYPRIKWVFHRAPYPPLGIAYLSAVAREQGFDTEIIDHQIMSAKEYQKRLSNLDSDIIAVSASIMQLPEAIRTLRAARGCRYRFLGGPGPSAMMDRIIKEKDYDVLFRGEGEIAFSKVLELVRKGSLVPGKLRDIKGIVFRDSKGIVDTGLPDLVEDLDTLPFPDRDHIDMDNYFRIWKKYNNITSTSMISSRGCPYSCLFCDKYISRLKYRARTPKNVVDEIEMLHNRYHPDDVFFYDDTSTLEKGRMIGICGEMKRRKLKQSWSAHTRVNCVDEPVIKSMAGAGCKELMFGVESGSPRILKYLNKGITPDQVREAFRLCHRHGIKPGAYFMVGVPGETMEDLQATLDLMFEIKPFLINVSYLTAYPNTRLDDITKDIQIPKDFLSYDDQHKHSFTVKYEVPPNKALGMLYSFFKKKINPEHDQYFVREQINQKAD